MESLRVDRVTVSFGIKRVFSNVSFGLGAAEKLALVGPNGAGKTTLLRVILGETEPESGHVRLVNPATRIGYLPQAIKLPPGATVGGLLRAADANRFPAPGRAPARRAPGGGAGGAGEAAKRFHLSKYGPDHPVELLSGGERTRLALACLWLEHADLLLLDEPTNHLDMGGLAWLSGWVREFPGPVLVVSHDRYFMDEVAERVVTLEDGCVRSYPGNYTAYRRARQQEVETQMALYREQEREARRLRAAAVRQAQWFKQAHDAAVTDFYRRKAKKLASRSRALTWRMEQLEADRIDQPREGPQLLLRMRSVGRASRDFIVAEGLGKAFGRRLFGDSSFVVQRGEKVGLVGGNGSGKTTLLRMIAGQEPASEGRLWVTPAARLAYLDQHAAGLRDGRLVLDEVVELVSEPARARTLLGSFLFSGDSVMAQVGTLSAGERTRLALLCMLLSPANMLLLDEPTNYLDLPARERVEAALESYDGSLVLVSHDRYLLRRVCGKILAIEGGKVVTYLGGYEEFAEKGGIRSAATVAAGARSNGKDGDAGRAPGGSDPAAERLLLENQVAVLSARLAGLAEDHPDHGAVVSEFLEKARALRLMR
ncbi:MAG: ABC-F family ATP-binding cassette domain-containing protein [Bacillota bacterium]|nr:ABC-F family ATP-binding cassette domain-containing protein [Bacillota bacterium]